MDIEAIIFDFDGVLAESVSVKGDAFVDLYAGEDQEIQAQVRDYHDANCGVTRFEKITYYEKELCKRNLSDEQIVARCDEFTGIVEQMVVDCAWVPGAKDFMDKYHGKIPYYVASAAPEEELRRIVESRGMTHYFEVVYGAPGKKYAHIMRVLSEYGHSPQRTLMIGDAMLDYNAALKAGLHFIGRKLPENDGVPFPEGTLVINDLSELENYIRIIS